MGEMRGSVKFHYTKGNIEALRRISEDITVDDEDRDLAKKCLEEIKEEAMKEFENNEDNSLITKSEIEEEMKNEKALWRSSIKTMLDAEDLEGLLDLKEGPEILDDDIKEFLDNCINQLESRIKGKSQAE